MSESERVSAFSCCWFCCCYFEGTQPQVVVVQGENSREKRKMAVLREKREAFGTLAVVHHTSIDSLFVYTRTHGGGQVVVCCSAAMLNMPPSRAK